MILIVGYGTFPLGLKKDMIFKDSFCLNLPNALYNPTGPSTPIHNPLLYDCPIASTAHFYTTVYEQSLEYCPHPSTLHSATAQ